MSCPICRLDTETSIGQYSLAKILFGGAMKDHRPSHLGGKLGDFIIQIVVRS